ncbi:MAG: AI-2E family transporter [Spirochaetia bacterium]|nr:AI-2E family transporter [Spirochaetia bacterium]
MKTVVYAAGIVLLIVVLKYGASVTLPLMISLFCFFILSPFVNRMEKAGFPRWLAILLAMAVLVMVFFMAILFFSFAVNTLISEIPRYSVRISMLISRFDVWVSEILDLQTGISFLESFTFNWQGLLINILSNVSESAVSIFSSAFIIFIFVLFLLMERRSLIPKMKVAMPNHGWIRWAVMFERINRQISKYLTVKALFSLSTGVLFYLAAIATRLDFAFIIGVLAFILNFIPTIGSIIITVTTICIALIQYYPDYASILYVSVLMASIQIVLGNILDPRVQGNRLNLSPFVILVSLALWGYIWGIIGMFLAVPITAGLQIMCDNVKPLKPIAVLLSSGKQYRKQIDTEERQRKDRYSRERVARRLSRMQTGSEKERSPDGNPQG